MMQVTRGVTYLFILFNWCNVIKGSCIYKGIKVKENTVWKQDSCTICTCQGSVALCEKIQCTDPRCNFHKGEVLRISANKCCPECTTPGPSCTYRGKTYQFNTEWRPSPCTSCHCSTQGMVCKQETCEEMQCADGEVKQQVQGKCCPQCIAAGIPCQYQGQSHADGTEWTPLSCTRCVCRDGHTKCYVPKCPSLACGENEGLQRPRGSCCLQCTTSVCVEGEKTYQDGTTWNRDSCTICVCNRGKTVCKSFSCESELSCQQDETVLTRPGECCPSCVSKEASCIHSNQLHYHGDLWNASNCEYCICDRGRTNCYKTICDPITCGKGEVIVHKDGKCCPECEGTSVCEMDGKVYKVGQSWKPGNCQLCICGEKGTQCLDCSGGHRNQKFQVTQPQTLIASAAELTVISSQDHLNIQGSSDRNAITFTVLEGPVHGKFVKSGSSVVRSFSAVDLAKGSISYKHNGGQSTQDLVLLQATDGHYIGSVLMELQIRSKTSKAPILMVNKGAAVESGKSIQLTKEMLSAVATGTKNVIYTLTPPSNNPKEGNIVMIVPVPSEGAPSGWKDLGDGHMMAKMWHFLQRDIDEGRMWYQHKGGQNSEDGFVFEVSDGSKPPQSLENQVFHISIIRPSRDQATNIPTVAPGVQLEMTVYENQLVPIMSSHLAFVDSDTDDKNIVYTITKPLSPDQGTVEHIHEPFKTVTRFSQADVNMNRIIYRPPMKEIGMKEKKFTFSFVVQDQVNGQTIPEKSFTIRVMPVNNMPPKIMNPKPVVTVTQGGTVPIGSNVIYISDSDTVMDDLVVLLAEAPQAGTLVKKVQGMRVELRSGDTFMYKEIMGNVFHYTHDGSTVLEDWIQFIINDGVQRVPVAVKITVIRVDKSAPIVDPRATLTATVKEGSSVTIEQTHLAFSDPDSDDEKLAITLNMTPMHGQLMSGVEVLKTGDKFTQEEVKYGMIKYSAGSEVGGKPIVEVLNFNVTDSSGNMLPNQVFAITITPENNQQPIVTVGAGIEVQEGDRIAITSSDLSAMDMDTPVGQLTVVIDQQPTFGFIENINRDPGSELASVHAVSSFPLQDLINGHVFYVQNDHKNKEPVADAFLFHVTDGVNMSPSQRFNISILLTNDEVPVMVTEQIYVKESRGVTMTNASMYVIDLDSLPEDLVFTVNQKPQHGNLRRKEFIPDMMFTASILQQGDTFTYEDVLHELIGYTNEDETTEDQFTLTVTDGEFSETKTMKVVIGLVNDETPRVVVNRGLQIPAGSTTVIKSSILRATDVDSEDSLLTYTLTKDVNYGHLRLVKNQKTQDITTTGPVKEFTQQDIDRGYLQYTHLQGEDAGIAIFKFSVSDAEGNGLIDQSFVITILEDRIPPKLTAIKEFSVQEGSKAKITTQFLSASDDDSEPGNLLFTVTEAPLLGHLEIVGTQGAPVTQFRQSDLAAGAVQYVHTSEEEKFMDSFTFSLSDGSNEIYQKFYITIIPVDDSLPVVSNNGLKVQEGVRKLVTEFDLKAVDKDTKEDHVFFHVVQPPLHGSLDLFHQNKHTPVSTFSMADIYENRVSYQHDGSETRSDSFAFTVTDGTNPVFMMQADESSTPTSQPMMFEIAVSPVDDGSPILVTNLGLHYLEYVDGRAMNAITQKELKAEDIDTEDKLLIYQIKTPPQHGRVETLANPGVPISVFSQEDIKNGVVRYVLSTSSNTTIDKFVFDLIDSKPNVVKALTFHIRWSYISFEQTSFNITETAGVIRVPVKRRGNLQQYSIINCKTSPGSAVSSAKMGRPGLNDFEEHIGQVQFDEWQDTKTCTIVINDDSIFEGPETLYVELSEPAYALQGEPSKAAINIYDFEDEPVIQFEESVYHVNESDGFLFASVERSGDISTSAAAVCYTKSVSAKGSSPDRLESGSDFKTRPKNDGSRVVFPAGVTKATCDVQIIDDSIYESAEQFELVLEDPSFMAKIGPVAKAIAFIDGPNDESLIYLSDETYNFDEDAGQVEISIIREGSDLSHSSMVWCATKLSKPSSATPGQDYVPTSNQITFGPGQSIGICRLTLLDDTADPRVEGNETFVVFLSAAMGSALAEPYSAVVTINDTNLDIPTMKFEKKSYTVAEKDKFIEVPILRSGDLSYSSSVVCYTRQKTAQVMMDYDERTLADNSRVTFLPGEQVKKCRVGIVDDTEHEPDEEFKLKLGLPEGSEKCGAAVGDTASTAITITNNEDVPTIQIEKPAYSVNEPDASDKTSHIVIKIIRTGDNNGTSRVRCSTRDGSAVSGMDYNARSKMIKFKPGQTSVDFKIDILYNDDVEWHETFVVMLGPNEPIKAVFGEVTLATITILDHEVSGSLVLPSAPVVVSLLDYDNVEAGSEKDPSPGYPLVCVTPCDVHYPSYSVTGSMCKDSGINQTAVQYQWEVAMPVDLDGSRPPFEIITDNTLFTSVDRMVLDSIYVRPGFKVRCVAQPVHHNGNRGVPLRSNIVTIGINNGICHTPITAGKPHRGLQAQSFIADLQYVDPSDEDHPNSIHVSIKIPHQDGLLPLLSTYPLHNLRFLLSEPVYRRQHVCSNLITTAERTGLTDTGFLDKTEVHDTLIGPGYDRPYQFDPSVREPKSINLYKHLNLKSCIWTFDSWYHMSELIDICGGAVISDFMVRDAAQSYLTVRVPLHVSYIYATAPTGWGSLEHRTEMEFSFFYNTVLWRTGLETEGNLSGRLQVLKIVIGNDGKLLIDFKTQAKFRGQYVMEHHTLPGFTSRVLPPSNIKISFDLALMWSQQTFDGPVQLWRAVSKYNLKDYSGDYTIELIPCSVKSTQSFTQPKDLPLLCTGHHPQSFTVPISFQQTNRPVPLVYSLNTQFQLTNNEKMFLWDPRNEDIGLNEMDYNGAFTKGQTIFGRVLWNPEQDLETAYKLKIEKVYICTGKDGFVPTYDPTGEVYQEGPQYGCIQPSPNLKYRFLILDRGYPEAATKSFNEVDFAAQFASDTAQYSDLRDLTGVDGFTLQVDPLYKVDSGHQWYLQVIYIIGPADKFHRYQRDVISISIHKRDLSNLNTLDKEWIKNKQKKNGTNIKLLHLNMETSDSQFTERTNGPLKYVLPIIGGIVVIFMTVLIFVMLKRKHRKKENNQLNNTQTKCANNENIHNSFIDLKKNVSIRSLNVQKPESNAVVTTKGVKLKIKDTNLKKGERSSNNTPGTEV